MRNLAFGFMVLVLAGCSTTTTSSTAIPTPSAAVLAGGCGSTPLMQGHVPAWVDQAGAHNNPDGLPYVIADPSQAAGFIFGNPLRAGHPDNPTNKILWVVGLPRNGSSLVITGHPLPTATPIVAQSEPADSSPGEIYPSIVDVPEPGCWHFDLAWAGHHASVDLLYE